MKLLIGFTVWLAFITHAVYSTGCTTFKGIGPYRSDDRKPIVFGSYKCFETSKDIKCSKP